MSLQDPIADMLCRIRNAQMVFKKEVVMPASTAKASILKVLEQEGYISGFTQTDGPKSELKVGLKYYEGAPVIEEIKRVSRPGLRIYKKVDEMPVVKGGLGVAVISTCKGVMTARQAKQAGVGGELLCTLA